MKLATSLRNAGRWDSDPSVIQRGPSAQAPAARLAKGLGWFSLALGIAELVAARPLARALGMRRHTALLRAFGAREVASGIAVLSVDPRSGLFARVGGDAMDLAALALLSRGGPRVRRNVALALAAVAGVALLDAWCAASLQRRRARRGGGRDYSDRSGFPQPPQSMRGAAADAALPAELRAALPGSPALAGAGSPAASLPARGPTQSSATH